MVISYEISNLYSLLIIVETLITIIRTGKLVEHQLEEPNTIQELQKKHDDLGTKSSLKSL